MAIYLAQHGLSLPKDRDPRKGLSETGIAEVHRIAQVAAQYRVPVRTIFHSGKHRAVQTAGIFSESLNPPGGIKVVEGMAPLDDAATFSENIQIESNALYVGHLPFMERLISYLIIGEPTPPLFRMQNGGIICLDRYPESDRIAIRWALMPNVGQ